jgi:hypothetical protein
MSMATLLDVDFADLSIAHKEADLDLDFDAVTAYTLLFRWAVLWDYQPKTYAANPFVHRLKSAIDQRLARHETEHGFNFTLTQMLTLPRLTRMVVHKAMNVCDTKADPRCPLRELVLVDCWSVSLAFMDDLPQLRSLGLVLQNLWHGPLPTHVPAQTCQRRQEPGSNSSRFDDKNWSRASSPWLGTRVCAGLSSVLGKKSRRAPWARSFEKSSSSRTSRPSNSLRACRASPYRVLAAFVLALFRAWTFPTTNFPEWATWPACASSS